MNKQEFSASSWRSNQGYTKMHGQPTIKICTKFYSNYNNVIKHQLLHVSNSIVPSSGSIQLYGPMLLGVWFQFPDSYTQKITECIKGHTSELNPSVSVVKWSENQKV